VGTQVAKRRKPDCEARDEPGWKKKIFETFHKNLSLHSTLKSHLKGKCGKGEAWQEGPFSPLRAMAFAPWNRAWVTKPGSDTLWGFLGQLLPRPQ